MKRARDIIFDYLGDLSVGALFGVPGTNEIPIIDGTNSAHSPIRYIPCLHENIAMGAAAGYARMTGKPGIVELHVTPGAGHSIGNLFNAFKSHVPVVVLCGQQDDKLLLQEPLLASDLVQVARQYTKWAHELRSAEEFPLVLQRALKVAITPPTGPVFLSIPWNLLLDEVTYAGTGKVTRIGRHFIGDRQAIQAAARHLAAASRPIIVAGDGVGAADAWDELRRLAELVGAPVYTEFLSSMMNYPNNLPHWQGELPGSQEEFQQRFGGHDVAFLCGFNAQAQIVVFDYNLGPLIPDVVTQIYLHNDPWEIAKNHFAEVAILGDIKASLPLLSDAIAGHDAYNPAGAAARNEALRRLSGQRDAMFDAYLHAIDEATATGAAGQPAMLIEGSQVAKTLGGLQDEMDAPLVFVNEAVSDAGFFQKYLRYDGPTSYYCAEGGSLGYSMPAGLGIKVAVGAQNTVVNAVGDGSTLFYPQVWWTAAKFSLPILYLVLNNKEYKTLLQGLQGIEQMYEWKPSGPPDYLYLHEPPLSFVQIAASFGVQGDVVSDPAQLEAAIRQGLETVARGRPYVLEILTDPSLQPPTGVTAPAPRLDIAFAAGHGQV